MATLSGTEAEPLTLFHHRNKLLTTLREHSLCAPDEQGKKAIFPSCCAILQELSQLGRLTNPLTLAVERLTQVKHGLKNQGLRPSEERGSVIERQGIAKVLATRENTHNEFLFRPLATDTDKHIAYGVSTKNGDQMKVLGRHILKIS